MSLDFKIKSALVLGLITSASIAFAEPVLCPFVSQVQKASENFDEGTPFRGKFVVGTSQSFADNKINWFVDIYDIPAKSLEEAFVLAKKIAQGIKHTSMYAQQYPGEYFCFYGPGNIIANGFDEPIKQGSRSKFNK